VDTVARNTAARITVRPGVQTGTTSAASVAPVRRRVRRTRRGRRWLVALLVLVAVSATLMRLDNQVSTAVGAEGVGRGSYPVVEVAGLGSDGAGFARLTDRLQRAGTTVLDFDERTPGTQPLTYQPAAGADIGEVARHVVAPAVERALSRAGLDPATQRVDVVAHSMGGLLVRYLVEQTGGRWPQRVDDLVMVATPNHGSDVIAWETLGGRFKALGADMKPGSDLLRDLGGSEPAGEVYTTIGGDPWMFRWLRYGSHGFDDQVPSESPFLAGAANNTFPYLHGRLLRRDPVVSLIVRTLAAH
jgi:triacylglycerol esterase/lipase EstA (alpha/beta hydrolase family)